MNTALLFNPTETLLPDVNSMRNILPNNSNNNLNNNYINSNNIVENIPSVNTVTLENSPTHGEAPEKKGKHACAHCKKAHLACDFNRPCRRCINSGRECVDADHKPRGRPRMKERDSENMPIRSVPRQTRPSSGASVSSSSADSVKSTPSSVNISTSSHGGMVGASSFNLNHHHHQQQQQQHSSSHHSNSLQNHPYHNQTQQINNNMISNNSNSISNINNNSIHNQPITPQYQQILPSQQQTPQTLSSLRKYSIASSNYETSSEVDSTSISLMNVYLDSSLVINKYPPVFASLFAFPVINMHICDLLVLPTEQMWLTSCIDSISVNPNARFYGRLHMQCQHGLYLYDVCVRAVGMIEEHLGHPRETWYTVLSFGRGFEVMYDDE